MVVPFRRPSCDQFFAWLEVFCHHSSIGIEQIVRTDII